VIRHILALVCWVAFTGFVMGLVAGTPEPASYGPRALLWDAVLWTGLLAGLTGTALALRKIVL
jgi:hypothetical protein